VLDFPVIPLQPDWCWFIHKKHLSPLSGFVVFLFDLPFLDSVFGGTCKKAIPNNHEVPLCAERRGKSVRAWEVNLLGLVMGIHG